MAICQARASLPSKCVRARNDCARACARRSPDAMVAGSGGPSPSAENGEDDGPERQARKPFPVCLWHQRRALAHNGQHVSIVWDMARARARANATRTCVMSSSSHGLQLRRTSGAPFA